MNPAELRKQIKGCENCKLSSIPGIRPVPFVGKPSKIAVVGEAPGMDENKLGEPFVGASGRLLKQLLSDAGIKWKSLFVCNTVSCFPGGTPKEEHIRACKVNLHAQLKYCKPEYVLLVGGVAMRTFLPEEQITRVHGVPFQKKSKRVYYPVYHPAFALRGGRTPDEVSPVEALAADLRAFALLTELGLTAWLRRYNRGGSTSP